MFALTVAVVVKPTHAPNETLFTTGIPFTTTGLVIVLEQSVVVLFNTTPTV